VAVVPVFVEGDRNKQFMQERGGIPLTERLGEVHAGGELTEAAAGLAAQAAETHHARSCLSDSTSYAFCIS
jgi:hypothetical protein